MTLEEIQQQIDELKRIDAKQADAILDIKSRLHNLDDEVSELKAWARRMKE